LKEPFLAGEDKYELATRYWHEQPQGFSDAYRFSFNPVRLAAKMFLDQRTAQLKDSLDLNPALTVADVGCGSGEIIDWMAARSKFVHGLDISEAMIDMARRNVRAKNVALSVSDCAPIPLPETSVDRIVCLGVLDYLPDPAKFCRELSRITRPGGLIVVTAPKSPSLFEFLRWSTRFRLGLSGMPPIVSVLDRRAMEQMLRDCGLEVVKLNAIWTTMWFAVARKGG
jgi:ubiquinone/menaquinone biosynthesis C-methylase UbiE